MKKAININDALFARLTKPALWQRSEAPFWDDEHISKGMLEAHLNPGTDAASRRPDTIRRSVEWLARVIPAGSRILDLGCGPGLYASRLASLGYCVTCMDISARSLEYARAHDGASRYMLGNYLEMDFACEFDAVTLIYCDYAALTAPERKTILANVKAALKPGGIFIFDVFNLTCPPPPDEGATWSAHPGGGFFSPMPHICLEADYLYEDGSVRATRHVIMSDEGVADYIIWDTRYTEASLTGELEAAGLSVRGIYGGVCGEELCADSALLCCVAYKPMQE